MQRRRRTQHLNPRVYVARKYSQSPPEHSCLARNNVSRLTMAGSVKQSNHYCGFKFPRRLGILSRYNINSCPYMAYHTEHLGCMFVSSPHRHKRSWGCGSPRTVSVKCSSSPTLLEGDTRNLEERTRIRWAFPNLRTTKASGPPIPPLTRATPQRCEPRR